VRVPLHLSEPINRESAVIAERAASLESAEDTERAALTESAV
jgi:hypothetical protein